MEKPHRHRMAFGLFEADLTSGELWKAGRRVRIQSQPFRVLLTLLERPGEVVTRDELHDRVWGRDTNVDFDRALAIAINKVRDALGDSADNPRFIETLARRGYRFIAPVSHDAPQAAEDIAESVTAHDGQETSGFPSDSERLAHHQKTAVPDIPGAKTGVPSTPASGVLGWKTRSFGIATAAIVGLVAVLAIAVAYSMGTRHSTVFVPTLRQITYINRIRPAWDSLEDFAEIATDGLHLFAGAVEPGRSSIVQVDIPESKVLPLAIPDELGSVSLCDISPDGSRIIVRGRGSNESEQPLWILPVTGGSAERVSVLAHDATWMPDGPALLYAIGNELRILNLRNNQTRGFATLNGRAFWMRWSPDGRRLRFTLLDPITHEQTIWESDASGRKIRPVLANWRGPANECCGDWTMNGSAFIFQAVRDKNSDIWMLRDGILQDPQRLTNGPLFFEGPVAGRDGKHIFFTGINLQSQLEIYSPLAREFTPCNDFFSEAQRLEVSRDHQWIAWTDLNGRLWRSRIDGTSLLQLAPSGLHVFLAHWSPDGSQLAFMARVQGQAWQIYTVKADGTELRAIRPEARNQADPSWSVDGRSIAFGRVPDLMGHENATRNIEILDLGTGHLEKLAQSENLFSPRWSPDGRWIAAMSLDQKLLKVFDTGRGTWRTLSITPVADPIWSEDSKAIFAQAFESPGEPIIRFDVVSGNQQIYVTRKNPHANHSAQYYFSGLLTGDIPVIQSRSETANIYSLELPQ